jgi:hypothetical protein
VLTVQFFLALLVLFVGCAVVQSQEAPQGAKAPIKEQQIEQPQNEKQGSAKAGTAEKLAPIVDGSKSNAMQPVNPCNAECGKAQPEKDWWHEFRTDPIATFTGLLFVATLLLWWTTRALVKGAEITAERQLRAYVHPGDFSIDQFEVGKPIKISYPVRNYGQTPAHDMVLHGWAAVRPYPAKGGWRIVPSGEEVKSVTVCAPGDQNKRGTGISETALTQELRNQIVAGTERRLYAWGLITYVDIFGEEQTTEVRASTGGPDFAKAIDAALAASDGQPTTATITWEYSKDQNRAT